MGFGFLFGKAHFKNHVRFRGGIYILGVLPGVPPPGLARRWHARLFEEAGFVFGSFRLVARSDIIDPLEIGSPGGFERHANQW